METPLQLPRPFRHGLVVGKLRPPHDGHLYLVRSAASFCETLTVGVFDVESKRLPLSERVAILKECFPEKQYPNLRFIWAEDPHPIDYEDPEIWRKHVAIFEDAIRVAVETSGERWEESRPDALFTSESYGDELARRLQIPTHVCLDEPRSWKAVSATRVREGWLDQWEHLPLPTQRRLCLRVVILGAESTGTTTLTEDLKIAFRARGGVFARTQGIPEFGREFSAAKLAVKRGLAAARRAPHVPQMEDLVWTEADFCHIARTQTLWEEQAASSASPVLICDTDALATAVWHERYRGTPSPAVLKIAQGLPPRTLYVLTDESGVPFVQDGLRDGEHLRSWMTQRFEEVLKSREVPYLRVTGAREDRVRKVIEQLTPSLAGPLSF